MVYRDSEIRHEISGKANIVCEFILQADPSEHHSEVGITARMTILSQVTRLKLKQI
jgi:hypothetical protein